MKNKELDIDYNEDSYKFSSPMASFVYHAYSMNGDNGEEYDSNEAGDWWGRYGRRILVGNSQGFVDLFTYDTVEEAEKTAREMYWEYDDEETEEAEEAEEASCPQCGRTDHTSVYACELLQAERLIGYA